MYDPKAFLLTYEEIVQDWIYTGVVFLVRINADFIAFPFGFNHVFSCVCKLWSHVRHFFQVHFAFVEGETVHEQPRFLSPPCFIKWNSFFSFFTYLVVCKKEKKTIKNVNLFSVFCLVCSLLSLKLLYKCFFQLQKWAGGGGRGKSDVKSVLCGCKQPQRLDKLNWRLGHQIRKQENFSFLWLTEVDRSCGELNF